MPKVYVVYNPPCKEEEVVDDRWSCRNWTEYGCLAVWLWIFFLALFFVLIIWIMRNREGFGWGDEQVEKMFNLHPLLMILGFIFLEGISITLYRVCRCCRRIHLKLVHSILHLLIIPCAIVGFLAINKYSQNQGNKQFYTVHAWVGLLTLLCFAIQFFAGLITFLLLICCNRATGSCRADMVPLHAAFGVLNFCIAVVAVCTGLQEKLFQEKEGKAEETKDEEVLMVRILLILIFLILFFVHHILRREEFRYRAHLPNFVGCSD